MGQPRQANPVGASGADYHPADGTLRPPPVRSVPPPVPGHELLRCIGRGAYGEVWLAANNLGTLRAVKIVFHQPGEQAVHFDREFKGLQAAEPISRGHEGLVDILQVGRDEQAGYFFYVMELADAVQESGISSQTSEVSVHTGNHSAVSPASCSLPSASYPPRTLHSDLKRGALPFGECLAIGAKLASALDYLHAHGLVHRDIKPSNIIFVNGEPKLADIGLVTNLDDARSLVGTAGYIAPEGPGSPSADIYALGKVLYEMAFGKHRQEFPQLPADLHTHADRPRLLELNEIILKACESAQSRRYASAEAMGKDLEALANGKSMRRRRIARHRAAWMAKAGLVGIAAVLVVLLGAIIKTPHQNLPPSSSRLPGHSSIPEANDHYDIGRRCHSWYGLYLRALGRTNEAIRELGIACKLNPESVSANRFLGLAFLAAQRHEEAVRYCSKSVALAEQDDEHSFGILQVALQDSGLYEKAIDAEEMWVTRTSTNRAKITARFAELRAAYANWGEHGYWKKKLESNLAEGRELSSTWGTEATYRAQLYCHPSFARI